MGFLWLPRWRMWVLGCKGRSLQDIQKKIQYQDFYGIIRFKSSGRGGSASGRVTDFCPSGPGSNPGSTLGFFGQTISILPGRRAFSIRTNHRTQTMSSLLSCFLSSSVNIVSINCNQCFKNEINKNPKTGRERPMFRKNLE